MRTRVFRFLLALAVVLALGSLPMLAQGKSSSSHGGGQSKAKSGQSSASKSKSSGHQAAEHEPGPDERPKGWGEGGKEGWGDCNVPPGLAKERGCDHTGLSTRERAEKARREKEKAAKEKSKAKTKSKTSGTSATQAAGATTASTQNAAKSTSRATKSGGHTGGNTDTKAKPQRE